MILAMNLVFKEESYVPITQQALGWDCYHGKYIKHLFLVFSCYLKQFHCVAQASLNWEVPCLAVFWIVQFYNASLGNIILSFDPSTDS